jgi:hypothetical protein
MSLLNLQKLPNEVIGKLRLLGLGVIPSTGVLEGIIGVGSFLMSVRCTTVNNLFSINLIFKEV